MAIPGKTNPDTSNGVAHCAYLNRASRVIGNLFFHNAARIDGKVEGEIITAGPLIIGETAQIEGRIEAPSVVVSGSVRGDIKAAQRLEIHAPATIAGNLAAPILVVDPGALVDGYCLMPERTAPVHDDPAKPDVIVLEDAIEERAEKPPQGISFFITKRQRAELRARGYEDAAIDKMTPAQAHAILGLI